MAHFLQRLTFAVIAIASAAGVEFSHKQHLALKLTCVACHAAAPASSSAQDNLRPDPKFCAACHQESPVTVAPPRPSLVTKFNHQIHLKFDNPAPVIAAAVRSGSYLSPAPAGYVDQLRTATNTCLACHAGIDQSESLSHSYLPPMASCLVCHAKVDPPFSCSQCHADTPGLKPATHTADYIDRHSTGKANLDKPTCAVCHGRRFTCLGCH